MYGPHDNFNDRGHVIPQLIMKADSKMDPFEVWGDGTQVRDFTYVDDVVNANIKCMEHSSKLNGDVFNRNFDSSFFEEATQSLGERRSDLGNYDQPYLWVVGDGKYIVSFNSPLGSEDPQYLATKNNDNGYFVLDLNQIKDKYLNKELVAQKNPNWIIE